MQEPIHDTWLEVPPKLVRENRWTLWRLGKELTPKGRPAINLFQRQPCQPQGAASEPGRLAGFR